MQQIKLFSSSFSDKKSLELRRRKLAISGLYGSRIQCRFCNEKLQGNKQYFHHVRQFHLPGISKTSQNDSTIPLPEEITPQPTPIKKVWSERVYLTRKGKNQRNPSILVTNIEGSKTQYFYNEVARIQKSIQILLILAFLIVIS